jgi:F0F1-type ATP synthase gamma subunit
MHWIKKQNKTNKQTNKQKTKKKKPLAVCSDVGLCGSL